ncbi:unnamed protein product [Larinioides sclopetarius]|uniref:BTB domain-containing protein n=1 Tax=Larinioides sclopetarius TaxID=280406 RepID=A0AAV1YTU6_9ARAC
MFLPQDTLTARCRLWKSVGEMSKNVQCFARTRIAVEKRSFLWNIKDFSTFSFYKVQTYEIKSHDDDKMLMTLELSIPDGLICDELIRVKIIPDSENTKISTLKLSLLDASKTAIKCFQDDFWHHDSDGSKDYTLFYTKKELLEGKNTYLQNDVLSLFCECSFSCGKRLDEIEMTDSKCSTIKKKEPNSRSLNKFSVHSCIFIDNFKSMLNDGNLSDVKLKTKRQSYDAHKSILGALSPVFKAMFSNDTKEKINECVDIEDIKDDTLSLLCMLQCIYSAEVGELEWTSAIESCMRQLLSTGF